MDYSKLQLSFVFLLIMCIIQLLTGIFIVHSLLICILSILAIGICIIGLIYTGTKQIKK